MLNTRYFIIGIVLFFILSSVYFYIPVAFNLQYLKLIYYTSLFFIFFLSIKVFLYKKTQTLYLGLIKYFLLIIIFSSVISYITWNQSFSLSFRSLAPYLSYFLLFFMWRYKPRIKDVEKIIWILCIMHIVLYLYALSKAPIPVFGHYDEEREISDARGLMRLSVPGAGFMYLGYFLAISKYVNEKKKLWLIVIISLFILIVMHVIRQYILFSFIVGFLYVFKEIKWWKKLLIIIILLPIIFYIISSIPIFQNLIELTNNQISAQNEDQDIRIQSYKYFFFEYPENIINVFFGNGVPHVDSEFGYFYKNILNKEYGMYMSDVGYAQLFGLFGLFGLGCVLYLLYKVLKQKVFSSAIYAKLYMIFILLANILSGYFLDSINNISAICLALYILEYSNKYKYE